MFPNRNLPFTIRELGSLSSLVAAVEIGSHESLSSEARPTCDGFVQHEEQKMMLAPAVNRGAKRRGFTLVELVIVVLVIGILTAVAAPKMMNTATNARINGTKQSLMVLRDSLELYRAQNGSYPTVANMPLAAGLLPFLSGPFPVNQVTTANPIATVVAGTTPISAVVGTAGGWSYDAATGEIRVNDASGLAW